MPDWGPPLRRSPPPHFHDPRLPPRGDDRYGPRGYFDDPRGPPPPLAGPYEREDWHRRDPDPVRRTWPPERHPLDPPWRDSPPPPGFREPGFREPRREVYRDYPPEPDYPPHRSPGHGGHPPPRLAEYDPPPPPMLRLPPAAREVRLVSSNGARPHQPPHMFAPAPLPETARRELLDPPTDGYNPYGRRVREEADEPAPQLRHGISNVRPSAGAS